jgi:hypothetical protein
MLTHSHLSDTCRARTTPWSSTSRLWQTPAAPRTPCLSLGAPANSSVLAIVTPTPRISGRQRHDKSLHKRAGHQGHCWCAGWRVVSGCSGTSCLAFGSRNCTSATCTAAMDTWQVEARSPVLNSRVHGGALHGKSSQVTSAQLQCMVVPAWQVEARSRVLSWPVHGGACMAYRCSWDCMPTLLSSEATCLMG